MTYYAGTRFGQGYYSGAQGGFFSGIGNFLGRAVQRVLPVAQVLPGAVGRVAGAIAAHPVTSAVAGAAVAAGTTALVGRGAAQPGAGVVPSMRPMSGAAPGGGGLHLSLQPHFHVGRRGQVVKGRRRRMNVCNPHAIRRAIRRFKGFEHMARKVINFTHPKKVRKGYAKRPRKRTT